MRYSEIIHAIIAYTNYNFHSCKGAVIQVKVFAYHISANNHIIRLPKAEYINTSTVYKYYA